MKHSLPTETINKILNYLSTKAYTEVAGLISEIKNEAVQIVEPGETKAPITSTITPTAVAKE